MTCVKDVLYMVDGGILLSRINGGLVLVWSPDGWSRRSKKSSDRQDYPLLKSDEPSFSGF